jgi:acyl-CoA synthetase (AMP-forming)/AMP-acid ligase II
VSVADPPRIATTDANIASALAVQAAARPDATAIVCPWGRRGGRLSYAELDQRSDAVARGLLDLDIGPGVRTALMVRPGLDLFVIAFALFKAGAVPVLVDPGIGVRNMGRCLDTAAPRGFIGIRPAQVARIVLGWGRGSIDRVVTVGSGLGWGGVTLDEVEARGAKLRSAPLPHRDADDVAAIVFTSGSTGPPKGVVYRHGNFHAQVEAIRDALGIEPGEVELPTFPLFALFDPALGMSTVVPDMDPTRPARVDPRKIIEPIREFGVTTMFGSPALLDTVSRWGAPRGIRLDSLRLVMSAGAPVPPRVIERFASMLPDGAEIVTPYGATEALPVAVIGSGDILTETRHATDRGAGNCVGRPVPSIDLEVIEITDGPIERWEDAVPVPTGRIGEIVVAGAQVTREYWRAEHHDRAGKIRDGDRVRHRMGDLGWLDESGRLWFCGRTKHRVETPDGPMYPVPCEAVFNTHEAVARSALVGVELDGVVTPLIVIERDRSGPRSAAEALRRELLELARAHDHTRPIERVLFHRSFPVDIRHNSKIDRARLAAWAARRLGGSPAVVGS